MLWECFHGRIVKWKILATNVHQLNYLYTTILSFSCMNKIRFYSAELHCVSFLMDSGVRTIAFSSLFPQEVSLYSCISLHTHHTHRLLQG